MRRPDLGWNFWNLVSTIGAFLIALPCVVFLVNVVKTMRAAAPAGAEPWDGRTLEWSIPSPPPPWNFTGSQPCMTGMSSGCASTATRRAVDARPSRRIPSDPNPSTCHGHIWPLVMVAGTRMSIEPVVIGGLLTLFCTARFGLEYHRRPSGDGMVPPTVHRTDVRGTEA